MPSVIDYSKNDSYALGMVLYQMLAGGCTNTSTVDRIPIPKCYSRPIRTLAESLLHPDPRVRPGPDKLEGRMLALGFSDWHYWS